MEIPWKEEIYQPARKLQSLDEKRICTKFAHGKWIWYQGRKDGKCHNLPPNLKPRVNWYAKGAFTIFADQFAQIWYDTAMNNFFRPVNIYHLLTERKTPKVIFNMRLHEVIRDREPKLTRLCDRNYKTQFLWRWEIGIWAYYSQPIT